MNDPFNYSIDVSAPLEVHTFEFPHLWGVRTFGESAPLSSRTFGVSAPLGCPHLWGVRTFGVRTLLFFLFWDVRAQNTAQISGDVLLFLVF